MPVPASDLPMLGKLLALLGSDNSGERSVAALKATELLRSRKLDWHDVVRVLTLAQTEAPKAQVIEHYIAAWKCLKSDIVWTDREFAFLDDMTKEYRPTARQLQWLRKLYERFLHSGEKVDI